MLRPVVAVVVLLLAAGCATPTEPSGDPHASPPAPSVSPSAAQPAHAAPPGERGPASSAPRPDESRLRGCAGSGPVTFPVSPMREEDFTHLLPYGLLAGAHVTPIDHMYLAPPRGSMRDAFEVRAIADGVIYGLQPRDIFVDTGEARPREWRIDIAHTCTFTSYLDLLTSLDPKIEAARNASMDPRSPAIPIRAGQVLGRIGGQTLDFGVYDLNVTLSGFIFPEHYAREPWKIHTVDPFPYFDRPVRDMLLAKNLRQAEPRAGRIDQDLDGKLVGNWFEVGTHGYGGARPDKYWDGHLAIVHDYLDPTQVRFSIGNYSGQARQFGIVGNSPDPRGVSVSDGVVRLALAHYEYVDQDDPARRGFGANGIQPGSRIAARTAERVEGVALVEMLGDGQLRVEVFPGSGFDEVEGFTDAARLYER